MDCAKFFLPIFHHVLPRKRVTSIGFISLNTLTNVFVTFTAANKGIMLAGYCLLCLSLCNEDQV